MAQAARPGLGLEEHETLSHTLLIMSQQARGIRALTQQATGGRSRVSMAAVALTEAVAHLQETLLAELDRTYGDQAPWPTRTRYHAKGG
jgi:hypothetical protein